LQVLGGMHPNSQQMHAIRDGIELARVEKTTQAMSASQRNWGMVKCPN
jgi:hypothetical protein